MKTIETTIYKCDFCKKIYLMKYWAIIHELESSKNPANDRPCFHCDNLETKPYVVEAEDPNAGIPDYTLNLLYCSKRDVFLYPPKVEFKGNAFDMWDGNNETMPKTCVHGDDESC